MLVRLVFSAVVTLGLLVGAVVWHGDGSEAPPQLEPVPELAGVVEQVRDTARAVAAEVEAVKREAAPVIEQAARVASAIVAVPATEPDVAAQIEAAGVESVEPADVEEVEEARIDAYQELPFLEGPPDEAAEVAGEVPDEVAAPVEIAERATDQDEWAGLIRRMLSIYDRVGAPR